MLTALPKLCYLQAMNWDAKYDWTMVKSRLICCLTSVSPVDMNYWADDTVTEIFCDIADILLPASSPVEETGTSA